MRSHSSLICYGRKPATRLLEPERSTDLRVHQRQKVVKAGPVPPADLRREVASQNPTRRLIVDEHALIHVHGRCIGAAAEPPGILPGAGDRTVAMSRISGCRIDLVLDEVANPENLRTTAAVGSVPAQQVVRVPVDVFPEDPAAAVVLAK